MICVSDAFSNNFYNEEFNSKVEVNSVSGI